MDNGTTKVAFIKTSDRVAGVRKAINLLGINPVSGKNIFLKPNFNSADPTPGSTHPDVLRAIVGGLREMGAGKITVGDRSGMGDTRAAMEALGVFDMGNELGFETVVFDELSDEDWELHQPPGSHWKGGYPFARPVTQADVVVQTCCLKTHRHGGHFTMSLKNSVGMVAKHYQGKNYMTQLHTAFRNQRRMIAEVNTAYSPGLIVLDGIEAFVSGGPANGELAASEVILAGTDRIAIDAIGVALLRHHGAAFKGTVFEQDQIARAVELGLGVDSPDKIEFVTPDSSSAAYAETIKALLTSG